MASDSAQNVFGLLWRFGERHRGWLVRGGLAALCVVVLRVALPWPLRMLLGPWLDAGGEALSRGAVIGYCLVFGGMMLALGLVDFLSRLWFARYSIGTVQDLRAHAFEAANRESAKPGDFISRLVGDTARIKAGMKGFLVHVATNGALAIGVTGVMLWIYWPIGVVLLVSAVVLGGVTLMGARRVYLAASRYRAKEGKLADAMQRSYERPDDSRRFRNANRKSGRHEANITRIQGLTTWAAHAVFAAMVAGSLILGFDGVSRGTLEPAAVAIFVMYALMLRGPIVQLARQGSRTGKIAACAHRVAELMAVESTRGPDEPVPAIVGVRLVRVRVLSRSDAGKKKRVLGPIDLALEPGQRVAVVGPPACGKSTLLRVIAKAQRVHRGTIEWDGLESGPDHQGAIAFVSDAPHWNARPLSELLDLLSDECRTLVSASGLFELGTRDWGVREAIVGPDDLSATERRIVGAINACLSPAHLVVLDDPTQGLGPNRSARFIRAICEIRPDRIVVIGLRRVIADASFDCVVKLREGRVVGALESSHVLEESA